VGKRGLKGLPIESLPYRAKVYINGQVLIPARLVRKLKLEGCEYASVVLKFKGKSIKLAKVKLLRTRFTSSRQFTIPKRVREELKVLPESTIEIVDVKGVPEK